ncbi:hypothetical protein IJI76_03105 [Candidatus Saccharibacteria bacterium]|nr:hypothetical protein [Candidatus Saccharibacteria bacterium]
MQKIKNLLKRGDTIIEVTFAISVFSLISIVTIQIMDRDIATIQGALETEMARNEIDAQAEALRFIHNSYLSERELDSGSMTYRNLWLKLSRGTTNVISSDAGQGLANLPTDISQYTSTECSKYYDKNNTGTIHNIFDDNAFVINTRKINPSRISDTVIQASRTSSTFREASVYPRVIYTRSGSGSNSADDILSEIEPNTTYYINIQQQLQNVYDKVSNAEGIWIISARDVTKGESSTPDFYDFHIRTCWFAPGHDRPSTIATTIRLYNPERIEGQK